MLTQSSIHVDSLRRRATSYFPRDYNQPTKYRPALNVKTLIKFLKRANHKSDESTSESRKRSASPLSSEGTPKRRKTSPAGSDDSEMFDRLDDQLDDGYNGDGDGDEDSDDADWGPDNWDRGSWGKYPYAFVYPLINDDRDDSFLEDTDINRGLEDRQHIPVFRHSFELQYTKDIPDDDEKEFVDDHFAKKRGWDREENELMDLVKEIGRKSSESTSIDLGRLWLCRYRGRYVGLSEEPEDPGQQFGDSAQAESNKWFVLVPSIPWPDEVNLEAEDYTESKIHDDMLMACSALGAMGRVAINTNVRLVVLPASAYDASKDQMPFCLQVDCTVSLVVPTIHEPISNRGLTKRDLGEKEGAQRRLLCLLFPPSVPDTLIVPHLPDNRSTDIPFLYSILTSAPRLPSMAEESMQPDGLLPTLLPFQRRSVGWMLQREGKTVDSEGTIVPKSSVNGLTNSSLPLFWDKIEREGGDIWYIHRLTGTLSSEMPEEECPPGGILAEEPGLGKTLECIALILLNPTPGRNPTISRWDSEAKITLKEIKVFRFLSDENAGY
jgi:E3 ubiquitin-protein ligase SHPRH